MKLLSKNLGRVKEEKETRIISFLFGISFIITTQGELFAADFGKVGVGEIGVDEIGIDHDCAG